MKKFGLLALLGGVALAAAPLVLRKVYSVSPQAVATQLNLLLDKTQYNQGENANLTVSLRYSGNRIPKAPTDISLDGSLIKSERTNNNGDILTTFPTPISGGLHTLSASFAGSPYEDFNLGGVIITDVQVFPDLTVAITVQESGSEFYEMRVVKGFDVTNTLMEAGQCLGSFCYIAGSEDNPQFAPSSGVLIGATWSGGGRLDGHGVRRVGGVAELIIFDRGTYVALVYRDSALVARRTFVV